MEVGVEVQVRRARERYTAAGDGIESAYAFSFGDHYDPGNIHFGPLLACNEERLRSGAGFAEHRHRDTEIVTWVVEGALEHRDSAGSGGVVRPGTVQRISAGAGVLHTERNAGDVPVRFVQMWLQPDTFGGQPDYAHADIAPDARHAVLASGRDRHPEAAVRLRRADAALHLVRSGPTTRPLKDLPEAPFLYLHVVRGELHLMAPAGAPEALGEGDSARVRDSEWLWPAVGADGVELLVWEAHSDLRLG